MHKQKQLKKTETSRGGREKAAKTWELGKRNQNPLYFHMPSANHISFSDSFDSKPFSIPPWFFGLESFRGMGIREGKLACFFGQLCGPLIVLAKISCATTFNTWFIKIHIMRRPKPTFGIFDHKPDKWFAFLLGRVAKAWPNKHKNLLVVLANLEHKNMVPICFFVNKTSFKFILKLFDWFFVGEGFSYVFDGRDEFPKSWFAVP